MSEAARLDQMPLGRLCTVQAVHSPEGAPEWGRQLEEIGFYAGEEVMVMTRGFPGGDPLVVRIGQSAFALRCAEAACIEVAPVRDTA